MTAYFNITGMQGDRLALRPVLERFYPEALGWSHNWTYEQVVDVINELGIGRPSKIKTRAIELLKGKINPVLVAEKELNAVSANPLVLSKSPH